MAGQGPQDSRKLHQYLEMTGPHSTGDPDPASLETHSHRGSSYADLSQKQPSCAASANRGEPYRKAR